MPSDPTVLAFDTSAAHCAAALLRGGQITVSRAEAMTRGQAERLMPLLEEVLAEAGCTWQDLDAVGVGTGPGNFTGIRISVSAARGLALGLGVPAIGVDGFDALANLAPEGQVPAIRAPREQAYVRLPGEEPKLISTETPQLPAALYYCEDPETQARSIAKIATRRIGTQIEAPAPLYVRPADAAPSKDVPPILLDG
ncbi:tRNA (adenosine(37)-N6)-threonylcarbamoyltransferase complex dimerization subunit type 1 TsaB [Ruegeria sp.]|uniref:tRNA (adenosine(37)-N6)-threonylcarbamoyltransferase complex dimerization subunit type 1 TsaB n=1 Tax=Ruegeria sp. TaxID=1879320 RepID=UPI003C7C3580